ncbi:iron ABC transporter permease [Flavobacterium sp. CYK-55]|uniref:iron ABC transporter permease n=1 Tax=Flavobacterium sp. CYK-55 TaxID=2835529 RepID=UPI001BCBD65A|nr:iron ABC transporter permease [Flavobacterium sp. CYK-55]MBS7787425.1 iron ABC transporter permease [Flavobacterium sp. CYK-55]
MQTKRSNSLLLLLLILAMVLAVADLSLGSVVIPMRDVLKSLTGQGAGKSTWEYIVLNYRLPKTITAILTGAGLSTCGLLMQTLFRNPLAGPYVLGLSSGSSLGVALVILGAAWLPQSWNLFSEMSLVVASLAGSFVVLMAVLAVSQKLRDTMSILIVGLMFGSFTSAFVSILTYFSSAEQLQKFTFWSMGNLGNLSWNSLATLACCVCIGLILTVFCIKSLDALLLGENYARSLGINYPKTQTIIIIATSILAGSITAFTGPIAFIGLAVPHIARLIFKTSQHRILFWATIILGAIIMLLCDILSQPPGTDLMLPINAITSIIGAPVVIWLLLQPAQRRH